MDKPVLPGITHAAYYRLAAWTSSFGDLLRDSVVELARRAGDDRPISPTLVDQAAIDACNRFRSELLSPESADQNAKRPAA